MTVRAGPAGHVLGLLSSRPGPRNIVQTKLSRVSINARSPAMPPYGLGEGRCLSVLCDEGQRGMKFDRWQGDAVRRGSHGRAGGPK